jgi:endo-1,4-beta-D-glucanase Y
MPTLNFKLSWSPCVLSRRVLRVLRVFMLTPALALTPMLTIGCTHPSAASSDGNGSAGRAGNAGASGHGGGGSSGSGNLDGGAAALGGRGGNTGGGADAGSSTGGSAPPRGPTPATATVRFPFPQNRESARCFYPAGYLNDQVRAAYDKWKLDTVTSVGAGGFRRVKRTQSDYTGAGGLELEATVSEGIAYGMLLAVYMGDQSLFDDLWKYEQTPLYQDDNGLMHWYISADGQTVRGSFGATDADEDMAFALVMADRQWGGRGSLSANYLDVAKDQINKVWNHEVLDSKLAGAGDHFLDWTKINISYFAPAYYRVFDAIDTDTTHDWPAVIKTVYDTITVTLNATNKNQSNGLVPAWCSSDGAPNPGVFGPLQTAPTNYQYDSCRTPFRIALDWCWFGTQQAKDYLAKTSAFFSAIGAANIADGYNLDGTPNPQHAGQRSAAFIGPAGVGAMTSDTFQPFINQSYATIAGSTALAGGAYYEESWTVMSLLMMTANFLDYTAY